MFYVMYKMSIKSYIHDDLEFKIIKQDNVIRIKCDDLLMNVLYEECFTEEYVINTLCLNNLNNFYNIICRSFENKMMTITVLQDKIELSINAEIPINAEFSTLVFRFDITLFVVNKCEINTMDTNIDKLEKRIKELEENTLMPSLYYFE